MDPSIPPSPAPSHDEYLPSGFRQLQQHNAATSYPYGAMDATSVHMTSQPVSRYGTPVPQAATTPTYEMAHPQLYRGHYQTYQPMYSHEGSPYGPLPDEMLSVSQPPYSTPATSPPTPSQRSDVINLRSGAVPRSATLRSLTEKPKGVEKAPKKKKERAKAPKKVAKLDKPLSELTKDWTHIPVVDIEAYVNRSSEERRDEVENGKIPGKIKRPMNAFMLYRKAYQNRTKDWCLHNNHQVVSQVCGDSWPLEPEHIRTQFNEWAKLERANHQKAHPGYKFTPAKPKNSKKKDGDEDGLDEPDGFNWETGQPVSRSRSRARTPLDDSDADYQPPRAVYHTYPAVSAQRVVPTENRSAFQYTNPGKPLPAPYEVGLLGNGLYYQQSIQPTQHRHMVGRGGIEDVVIHKTPSPSQLMQHTPPLDILPAQYTPPPRQQQQPSPPPMVDQHPEPHPFEQHIDPLLLPTTDGLYDVELHNNPLFLDTSFELGWDPDPTLQQYGGPFTGFDDGLPVGDQQSDFLHGADESWNVKALPEDESWMDPLEA